MNDGGFDVIIGNPPYVEYAKVQEDYTVRGYKTERCGNLYAFVVERSHALVSPYGRMGMIVPHSAFCTDRMQPLMCLFENGVTTWVSTYDIRPSKLFVGVDQRLAIYVTVPQAEGRLFSTRYHRWHESARPYLFDNLRYIAIHSLSYPNSWPKVECDLEAQIWEKIHGWGELSLDLVGSAPIYFHNAPRYWVRAMTFVPFFWNERHGEKLSTQVKTLATHSKIDAGVIAAGLNSGLFYWWFILLSDSRHLNAREIDHFHLGASQMEPALKQELSRLCDQLMLDYRRHAVRKECQYKTTGRVIYDEFYPRYSKTTIDEIDRLLAKHYGFTDEELDFIINYDLKYRLGQEAEGDADE